MVHGRYILHDKLGEGGMGVVYRATDRLNGQTVALKSVNAPTSSLIFNSMTDAGSSLKVALTHEFQMLASLRHPYIISVLDYGFDADQQPFFAMEYIEDAQTISQAALEKSPQERLRLIIQLTQALLYLHRHGVLHRDLKPGNVMVDSTGTVKVVDFGLALNVQRATSQENSITGTIPYLAPELLLESPPSVASDLYAIGIIACEILAGHHPFATSSTAELINNILYIEPDLTGLSDEMQRVIGRLMDRNPTERYPGADAVIGALCEASGQPVPVETRAIRESFLQAAKFVGRADELDLLVTALHHAENGESSLWLVGGESGIGKSRLLDELRIHAVVSGAIVLRGQAVSEGSAVYQLWREPLRLIAAYVELTDDEAAVLKLVLVDMDGLMGRPIPDAPPLDPQSTQIRLFNTLTAILKRQQLLFAIMLEDLHWAGSESLALLQHLLQNLDGMRVFIIGTYRHDEQPAFAVSFSGAKLLLLERLASTAVEALSVSMLGEKGNDPAILHLLQRETEGNAFFLVEVMRALADAAGQLNQIDARSLPDEVFAQGVQSILQRRLNHLPDAARKLLQFAAVVGRQIDLSILKQVDALADVESWLMLCSNAAILEVRDDRWRFSHDKLRQELLNTLPKDEKSGFHRQVAAALETLYPDNREHAAALANHWHIAGEPLKELGYCVVVGQQAQNNGAFVEAIRYFSRAITLLQALPADSERDSQEVALQTGLGLAIAAAEGYGSPRVLPVFERIRELLAHTENSPQIAPALMGIWIYYYAGAKYTEAIEFSSQIIKLAPKTDYPALLLVAGSTIHAGNYFALGDYEKSLEIARQSMRSYDPSLDAPLISMFQHHLGIVATMWAAASLAILGYLEQAKKYLDEAPRQVASFNHPQSSAIVLAMSGWILPILGDVEQTRINSEQGVRLTTRYEQPFWLGYATASQGWAEAQQGDVMAGIAQIKKGREIYQSAGGYNFSTHFLFLLAESYHRAGLIEDALECIAAAFIHVEKDHEAFYHAELHRLKGELLLKMGDEAAAEACFRQALKTAQAQKAKLFELRAASNLARLQLWQDKRSEAYQTLSEIYNWFSEGFDTHDLQEAKHLLTQAQSSTGLT